MYPNLLPLWTAPDLKETFCTDLVCAAVQQGKTMYCESCL